MHEYKNKPAHTRITSPTHLLAQARTSTSIYTHAHPSPGTPAHTSDTRDVSASLLGCKEAWGEQTLHGGLGRGKRRGRQENDASTAASPQTGSSFCLHRRYR
eukprot:112308-Pleurochrysis_carterae.AAC.2